MRAVKASVLDNAAATISPFATPRAAWLEAACIYIAVACTIASVMALLIALSRATIFAVVARSISFVRAIDRPFPAR